MDEEIKPYSAHIQEGLLRAKSLMEGSLEIHDLATKEDIFRSVVVLTHAHLEDFLRTLAESFLPLADEDTLNHIPLAGTLGRAEAFKLGKLKQHRSKTVEEVIRESVREYLDRSTFNNVTEVVSLLRDLGISLSDDQKEKLPLIENMIKRRHVIVHRADRVKAADGVYRTQGVDVPEVGSWVTATSDFLYGLIQQIMEKRNIAEIVKRKLNIKIVDEAST